MLHVLGIRSVSIGERTHVPEASANDVIALTIGKRYPSHPENVTGEDSHLGLFLTSTRVRTTEHSCHQHFDLSCLSRFISSFFLILCFRIQIIRTRRMTKAPCQARDECDPLSASNPSLVTAGLPARSTMKSPCIAASPTAPSPYHDHGTNNPSQDCLKSQSTLESNAHVQLSRKDINDVLHALQTLGRFVKEDVHGTHHRHPRCSFPSDGKLDHRHPSKQTYLYPGQIHRSLECVSCSSTADV